MTSIIAQTANRVIVPAVFLMSVYLLLRGHDAPGGGFIAALVAGAGVVLRRLARPGPVKAGSFTAATATGLIVAGAAGVAAIFVTGYFLGPEVWKFAVPVLGELKVTLSFVFDVGVYLVVVSVIRSIVDELGAGR